MERKVIGSGQGDSLDDWQPLDLPWEAPSPLAGPVVLTSESPRAAGSSEAAGYAGVQGPVVVALVVEGNRPNVSLGTEAGAAGEARGGAASLDPEPEAPTPENEPESEEHVPESEEPKPESEVEERRPGPEPEAEEPEPELEVPEPKDPELESEE